MREAWDVLEPTNPLKWSWHLTIMCKLLEGISRGTVHPRLIINVPPGSSKSMIVSVMWQAWEWGPFGNPSARFLTSSFELENVKRDTRKTRDLILSEWYRVLWPEILDQTGKLKRAGETSFSNRHSGTREGVAFVSIMGKRGDRVVIDDPHSLKGSESEKVRDNTVRLFVEGGLNRLNDQQKSAIVIVMQRLHERDLSGALLARKDLGFLHLRIPMEFEAENPCQIASRHTMYGPPPRFWKDPRKKDGELMDPVRMPPDAVAPFKVAEYSWAGQYQQRPAPREGGLFKVDRLNYIEADPGGGTVVSGWDLAGTKRKTSAFTARAKIRRVNGRFIIINVKRVRETPAGVKALIKNTAIDDGPKCRQSIPQDPGQAGVAQRDDMADYLAGLVFRFSTETGDKETRALGVASAIEAGIVDLVHGDWNVPFVAELLGFPNGQYKDQVDALSRAYSELVGKPEAEENAGPELVHENDAIEFIGDDNDPWSGLN